MTRTMRDPDTDAWTDVDGTVAEGLAAAALFSLLAGLLVVLFLTVGAALPLILLAGVIVVGVVKR